MICEKESVCIKERISMNYIKTKFVFGAFVIGLCFTLISLRPLQGMEENKENEQKLVYNEFKEQLVCFSNRYNKILKTETEKEEKKHLCSQFIKQIKLINSKVAEQNFYGGVAQFFWDFYWNEKFVIYDDAFLYFTGEKKFLKAISIDEVLFKLLVLKPKNEKNKASLVIQAFFVKNEAVGKFIMKQTTFTAKCLQQFAVVKQ